MDKSREQFEEWFKKEYETMMKDHEDNLIKFVSDQLFTVWKASRESLEVNLPSLGDVVLDDYFADGYNDALEDVKVVLLYNGVKVK